ncbi:protein of unknown function [Pseudodesulfovibrio profundus]|uniref:Uncharacterized protein n=1 Tax=Pseudodesulfovibrio profundus TaxID=57320 RepID=A0A2C8FFH6_9BACT|nr:hypothetical protein [Pseudodesulfovibrio profundus]SOB60638.1 protein of unknown function [Pseudodesulfovibrio profundus]
MFDISTGFDYNEKTDEMTFTHSQDVTPILMENEARRMSAAAPMGQGLGRKVASIDMVTIQEAKKQGYDLFKTSDREKWLILHPQYRTVRAIDTGRSGRIIVK